MPPPSTLIWTGRKLVNAGHRPAGEQGRDAAHYLPVDEDCLPTGEIRPVEGTQFDFRTVRLIGDAPYDHNFCLSDRRVATRDVARLSSKLSCIEMVLATSEPGLQFYSGAKLDIAVPGLDGRRYGPLRRALPRAANLVDAINHPAFPSPVLRPGERYRHETDYRFSVSGL